MMCTGCKVDGRIGDISDFVTFDMVTDVYCMELSKKGDKRLPAKTPLFHTKFGVLFLLPTLDFFHHCLKDYGFDFIDPSYLVNIDKIKYIEKSEFGNLAHLENGLAIPISRNKTIEYEHLIKAT